MYVYTIIIIKNYYYSVVSLILSGQMALSIWPFFFGASLISLEKKGGGIRPIAVGCTLCRLAAKVASGKVMVEMATLLSSRQLGYGVSKGAEAAKDSPSEHWIQQSITKAGLQKCRQFHLQG